MPAVQIHPSDRGPEEGRDPVEEPVAELSGKSIGNPTYLTKMERLKRYQFPISLYPAARGAPWVTILRAVLPAAGGSLYCFARRC